MRPLCSCQSMFNLVLAIPPATLSLSLLPTGLFLNRLGTFEERDNGGMNERENSKMTVFPP